MQSNSRRINMWDGSFNSLFIFWVSGKYAAVSFLDTVNYFGTETGMENIDWKRNFSRKTFVVFLLGIGLVSEAAAVVCDEKGATCAPECVATERILNLHGLSATASVIMALQKMNSVYVLCFSRKSMYLPSSDVFCMTGTMDEMQSVQPQHVVTIQGKVTGFKDFREDNSQYLLIHTDLQEVQLYEVVQQDRSHSSCSFVNSLGGQGSLQSAVIRAGEGHSSGVAIVTTSGRLCQSGDQTCLAPSVSTLLGETFTHCEYNGHESLVAELVAGWNDGSVAYFVFASPGDNAPMYSVQLYRLVIGTTGGCFLEFVQDVFAGEPVCGIRSLEVVKTFNGKTLLLVARQSCSDAQSGYLLPIEANIIVKQWDGVAKQYVNPPIARELEETTGVSKILSISEQFFICQRESAPSTIHASLLPGASRVVSTVRVSNQATVTAAQTSNGDVFFTHITSVGAVVVDWLSCVINQQRASNYSMTSYSNQAKVQKIQNNGQLVPIQNFAPPVQPSPHGWLKTAPVLYGTYQNNVRNQRINQYANGRERPRPPRIRWSDNRVVQPAVAALTVPQVPVSSSSAQDGPSLLSILAPPPQQVLPPSNPSPSRADDQQWQDQVSQRQWKPYGDQPASYPQGPLVSYPSQLTILSSPFSIPVFYNSSRFQAVSLYPPQYQWPPYQALPPQEPSYEPSYNSQTARDINFVTPVAATESASSLNSVLMVQESPKLETEVGLQQVTPAVQNTSSTNTFDVTSFSAGVSSQPVDMLQQSSISVPNVSPAGDIGAVAVTDSVILSSTDIQSTEPPTASDVSTTTQLDVAVEITTSAGSTISPDNTTVTEAITIVTVSSTDVPGTESSTASDVSSKINLDTVVGTTTSSGSTISPDITTVTEAATGSAVTNQSLPETGIKSTTSSNAIQPTGSIETPVVVNNVPLLSAVPSSLQNPSGQLQGALQLPSLIPPQLLTQSQVQPMPGWLNADPNSFRPHERRPPVSVQNQRSNQYTDGTDEAEVPPTLLGPLPLGPQYGPPQFLNRPPPPPQMLGPPSYSGSLRPMEQPQNGPVWRQPLQQYSGPPPPGFYPPGRFGPPIQAIQTPPMQQFTGPGQPYPGHQPLVPPRFQSPPQYQQPYPYQPPQQGPLYQAPPQPGQGILFSLPATSPTVDLTTPPVTMSNLFSTVPEPPKLDIGLQQPGFTAPQVTAINGSDVANSLTSVVSQSPEIVEQNSVSVTDVSHSGKTETVTVTEPVVVGSTDAQTTGSSTKPDISSTTQLDTGAETTTLISSTISTDTTNVTEARTTELPLLVTTQIATDSETKSITINAETTHIVDGGVIADTVTLSKIAVQDDLSGNSTTQITVPSAIVATEIPVEAKVSTDGLELQTDVTLDTTMATTNISTLSDSTNRAAINDQQASAIKTACNSGSVQVCLCRNDNRTLCACSENDTMSGFLKKVICS